MEGAQEIFNLYRIQVLTAGDDHVLLPVHQIDEAILILTGHIAGEEPAVLQDFGSGLGILIVAGHDAVALDNQLAHVALGHILATLIHDAGLPAKAGLADGTHLMDVLHAQMDTAGADGLGQAIVGIILMMREDLQPPLNQAGGHRLCAYMHQPPLIQAVLAQVNPGIDGIQQILGPRHQQPDDGALLFGHRPQNPLGLDATQQHGLGAGNQGSEPVHLGTGMVQGRNAKEHIVAGLTMVGLLGQAGANQGLMLMQNCLGEARGAGGEINRGIIILIQCHRRCAGGAEGHELHAVLGIGRAALAHIEQGLNGGNIIGNGIHPADKLRAEHQHIHVRQLQTILNLVAAVAEVHGHSDAAGFQDTEINGQPLDAVHQQNGHLGSLLQTAAQQQIGKAVGPAVEILPAQLPAIGGILAGAFDQVKIPPGHGLVPLFRGVDFYQAALLAVKPGITFKKICDYHVFTTLYK